jgi:outer membrane protein assembly factor BamA
VRSLKIDNGNIFDLHDPRFQAFYARLANGLHVVTREGVIRRGLHFREGDRICPGDIEASIRRLRTYTFLHTNVEIVGCSERDSVDLIVRTRDVWTTRPGLQFSKEGDLLTWSVSMYESNLLGLGKQMKLGVGHDELQAFWSAGYWDPQLLGSEFLLAVKVARGGERDIGAFSLEKRFDRATTPWGLQIAAESYVGVFVDRRGGLDGPEWDLDRWEVTAAAGPRVCGTGRSALRLLPAVHVSSAQYGAAPDGVGNGQATRGDSGPTGLVNEAMRDREIRAPGIMIDFVHERYVQRARINTFEHREDFNLGSDLSLLAGYSSRDLGASADGLFYDLQGTQGLSISGDQFLLAGLYGRGQFIAGEFSDANFTAAVRYYNTLMSRQTLAVRLRCNWGINLWPQSVFTLGAESGLRGFEAYRFWGDRVLIANLEDRVTVVEEFLGLVSFGFVGFVDAGVAWRAGEREQERPRVAVGIGLRILGSRSSGRLVTRIDVGYPVLGSGKDDGLIISIGSGQAF